MTVSAHGAVSKTDFPFHQPCLCIGFKTTGRWTPAFRDPTCGCCTLAILAPAFPRPTPTSRTTAVTPAGLAGAVRDPTPAARPP